MTTAYATSSSVVKTVTKTGKKTRLIRIPNRSGHVTIGWDASDDAKVIPIIDAKIREGWSFFTAHVIDGEDLHVRLRSAADLKGGRSVMIDDLAFRKLFDDGSLRVVEEKPGEELVTNRDADESAVPKAAGKDVATEDVTTARPARTKRAKSGAEVVKAGAAVAVRPAAGG